MWHFFRDYFPITLVKTVDLDPKRNYLLCAYPHGIISTGTFGAFGTEALGVREVFPGMEPVLVTLQQHFSSPFVRELALGLGEFALLEGHSPAIIECLLMLTSRAAGAVSSSERSLKHVLRDPNGGKMPILMVGGAAESLMSRPNKYHIILRRRRGFCRIAMQEG